jgi:hypothetical protein
VFTTTGKAVATFPANVDPIRGAVAIRKDSVVLVTNDGKLAVYTLSGELVHSYPVQTWRYGKISTYYGYAAFVDAAGKAVYVLKLSTGEAHEIVRGTNPSYAAMRTGAFSLQQSGLAVGRVGSTGFIYVPWKKIRSKFR